MSGTEGVSPVFTIFSQHLQFNSLHLPFDTLTDFLFVIGYRAFAHTEHLSVFQDKTVHAKVDRLSLALSGCVKATFKTLISVKQVCLRVLLMSSFSWTHKESKIN